MKQLFARALPIFDLLASPIVYLAGLLLALIRRAGIAKLPLSRKALLAAGVFPIRNHYYEPLFDTRLLRRPLSEPRNLPGIDWNTDAQLELLASFNAGSELAGIPLTSADPEIYHVKNGMFENGDADYLYQLLRAKKPRRLYEIGSGYSTLMAVKALQKNRSEDPTYTCEHRCYEPYERDWLERTSVTVVRKRVEDCPLDQFRALEAGDILFIDSSHMIRPQGDVLFEYLEILPSLRSGTIVHIHDIFSPRDYPSKWIVDEACFWNEQYLLEAFLSANGGWRIIGALNFLKHSHYEKLKQKCPFLEPSSEPGSFYMVKE